MEPKDPALVLQLGTGLVCGVGGIGFMRKLRLGDLGLRSRSFGIHGFVV